MKRPAPALTLLVSIMLAATAGPATAAKPKLSVGDVVVDESGSSAKVTVTASRAPNRDASVGFSSVDQTATAGQDYSATAGKLKIRAGRRSAKLAVPLIGDRTDEPEESFLVRLSGPRRAKVFDGESTVTIRDDDPLPRLEITTTSVPEGDSAERADGALVSHDLAFQLDRPSSQPVSIAYATSPGTATEKEFVAASGTVVLPAGQTAGTIPLATRGDLTDEFDEVLTVVLSDPRGLEPAEPAHPVTIVDDDPEPTIRLGTTTVQEGTSGNPIRGIVVLLSGGSEKPIDFDFAAVPGTATSPSDFAPIASHFSFPDGGSGGIFGLTTVGDYDDEPDETLTVEFSSPVNASLPATPQTLTILDDDLACVTPDPPTSPPPVNLGTVNGDTDNAPHVITAPAASNEISPCGDADWFTFTLHEDDGTTVDLTAKLVLQSTANDSPSNGDVNVCAQQGVGGTPACAPAAGAGQNEVLDVCVNDAAGDQSTALLVKVSGTGNAVNHYGLTITGHTTASGPVELNLGC